MLTASILIVSGYLINLIKKAEDDLKDKEKSKEKTNMIQIQLISGSSSFAIWVFISILSFFMRMLSESERPTSLTQLNVSMALKLTMARFIESSVILLVINFDQSTRWFDKAGLVYDATLLMILMSFSDPLLYLVNVEQ